MPWQALQLWNYPTIIKKPMDLGTVERKLPNYERFADFVADVRLVFSNCLLYNSDHHFEIRAMAKTLSHYFECVLDVLDWEEDYD